MLAINFKVLGDENLDELLKQAKAEHESRIESTKNRILRAVTSVEGVSRRHSGQDWVRFKTYRTSTTIDITVTLTTRNEVRLTYEKPDMDELVDVHLLIEELIALRTCVEEIETALVAEGFQFECPPYWCNNQGS